ncbi:MAG: hypothetical protein ABL961_14535 [Vicinamibacterales bacterium]
MSAGSRLLLAGLRGSGKTSFLAALWHLVESRELPTALSAPQLQPDRAHLNRIRDSWLQFMPVGRTSLRSQEVVSLVLRESATGAAVAVSLPDLSGELFRLQWATRKAGTFYADLALNASGIVLFLHVDAVRRSSRIGPAPRFDEEGHIEQAPAEPETARVREWQYDDAPTQVQIVELIQFARFLRADSTPLAVAVVLSAWDLVREPILPAAWLEGYLPLLSQYLTANQEMMPSRVYGVSALGGDLEKDLTRLQAESTPSRRIRVVEDEIEPTHDLTAPLRFVLAQR